MFHVDVLLMTALKSEHEAALLAVVESGRMVAPGAWRQAQNVPYPLWLGEYRLPDGRRLSLAATYSDAMGIAAVTSTIMSLQSSLTFSSLAMTGVCAGYPGEVALGDVIVASSTYEYGAGKLTEEGFFPDIDQSPMRPAWVAAARSLDKRELPAYGAPSRRDSEAWIVETLFSGTQPRRHPALFRYFDSDTAWKSALKRLEIQGLIVQLGEHGHQLTGAGVEHVKRTLYGSIEPPAVLPFELHVAPMASGSAVIKDGLTWDGLRAQGVRSVVGLEMEAAAIGRVARALQVPFAVIKGVMDHADPRKDDRFKEFAARASAEVLLALLDHEIVQNDIFRDGSPTRQRPDFVRLETDSETASPTNGEDAGAESRDFSAAGDLENFTIRLASAIDAAETPREQRSVAREYLSWAKGPRQDVINYYAQERVLSAVRMARTVYRALERKIPEILASTYSRAHGYTGVASFTYSKAFRAFLTVDKLELFAEELVEELAYTVARRSAAAVILSACNPAIADMSRFLGERSVQHEDLGVLGMLGLEWAGLREGDHVEHLAIFKEGGPHFQTLTTTSTITHVEYDRDGRRRWQPWGPTSLKVDLIDDLSWWLVFVPQAVGQVVNSAEDFTEADALDVLASLLDYREFMVGLQ